MAANLTEPLLLASIVAGTTGVVLMLHARVQTRLLRGRIARGDGSFVIDPPTGLFSATAAWQCIRAEASRAARLERPLDVWIGRAVDEDVLDEHGRMLAFDLPGGATAFRVDPLHVCVLACTGHDAAPEGTGASLDWNHRRIESTDDDAAERARAFVAEATHG